MRQDEFRFLQGTDVDDAYILWIGPSGSSTHDSRASLTSNDFGRFGTCRESGNLGLQGFFKGFPQLFSRLLSDGLREEFTIILPGETVSFAVQNQNGIHLGKQRRQYCGINTG
eukprot:scaffold38694_cov191-Amphora_coffeaeformis.AAC.2